MDTYVTREYLNRMLSQIAADSVELEARMAVLSERIEVLESLLEVE